MNTQGWVRGLIAHNSPVEKFLAFVCNTISSEFEFHFDLDKKENKYLLTFSKYRISISEMKIAILNAGHILVIPYAVYC